MTLRATCFTPDVGVAQGEQDPNASGARGRGSGCILHGQNSAGENVNNDDAWIYKVEVYHSCIRHFHVPVGYCGDGNNR